MDPSRRGFLKKLLTGAVATAGVVMVDPEKLLWIPGARSFFIPDTTIAIRNIALATDAQTAAITGEHFVRIKFVELTDIMGGRSVGEKIVKMTEAEFARVGAAAFGSNTREVEVHFDNGTAAYGVDPARQSLETIRGIADQASARNRAMVAAQVRHERAANGIRPWATEDAYKYFTALSEVTE